MHKYADCDQQAVATLLQRYSLTLEHVRDDEEIPGSFWLDSEAGLIGHCLYIRDDTPLHSILHETCHYLCMDDERRRKLNTNAGGGYEEENAVCYLQVLLADFIPGFGREKAFGDMDAWGYSFRLGSTQAWFEGDAADARDWLLEHGIIDVHQQPTWRLRTAAQPG